jgi:hypothetical protein
MYFRNGEANFASLAGIRSHDNTVANLPIQLRSAEAEWFLTNRFPFASFAEVRLLIVDLYPRHTPD